MVSVVAGPVTAAQAHGVGGAAADAGPGGFFNLGITHMLAGWDHIMFVAGVLIVAGSARRAAHLVSLFVAGHSLTLITATLAGWRFDPYIVDVLIVTSLVFVGGQALLGRPRRWALFGAGVLGFGLIHGLGLATRFQALGVEGEGRIWKLLAFHVGIEVGQLTAIAGVLSLAIVVALSIRAEKLEVLARPAAALLFVVGVVAAPAMVFAELA